MARDHVPQEADNGGRRPRRVMPVGFWLAVIGDRPRSLVPYENDND